MLVVILGYGLVFVSIFFQLFYWRRGKEMQGDEKIRAICKVIILRTIGLISCVAALIFTNYKALSLYATFSVAFVLLLYDVWRLKTQVDQKTNK